MNEHATQKLRTAKFHEKWAEEALNSDCHRQALAWCNSALTALRAAAAAGAPAAETDPAADRIRGIATRAHQARDAGR